MVEYFTSMSVGSEIVDVYKYDLNNNAVTAFMLRSNFVPVRQIIEQEFLGSK